MNDIRRTILWVIFGFSLVLLWDKWQIHNGRKPTFFPTPEVTAQQPAADAGKSEAGVPATTALAANASNVPGTAGADGAAAAAVTREKVTVASDLFRLTFDGEGGSLVGAELLKYTDQEDKNKPVKLLDESAARVYVAQTGLIGGNFPTHKTVMTAKPGARELADGQNELNVVFQDLRLPADALLGGEPGRGFYQMMDGVEVGRVNVAARACGLANRAFELGVDYAQQRVTFGKQIAEHQAVGFRLAEMATKVEAAHLMMVRAARTKDSGARNDLEAGMAKYLASEYCKEVVEDSFRIHGGYGYSKEYEIERLYREAPMLLIGEGTADIQRMIIARRLLEEYKLRG